MFEKILLVEDDEDMRNTLVSKLLTHHYEIIQAEDGEQAVTKFYHHRPNLIILDLLLPKLDGFGVMEKLRSKENEIPMVPIIILSNFSDQGRIERAQQMNVSDYMVKATTQLDWVCQRVEQLLQKPAA